MEEDEPEEVRRLLAKKFFVQIMKKESNIETKWSELLKDVPELNRKTYGGLTPAEVNAAAEEDRLAYLKKYWPDLEERMKVHALLKGPTIK